MNFKVEKITRELRDKIRNDIQSDPGLRDAIDAFLPPDWPASIAIDMEAGSYLYPVIAAGPEFLRYHFHSHSKTFRISIPNVFSADCYTARVTAIGERPEWLEQELQRAFDVFGKDGLGVGTKLDKVKIKLCHGKGE